MVVARRRPDRQLRISGAAILVPRLHTAPEQGDVFLFDDTAQRPVVGDILQIGLDHAFGQLGARRIDAVPVTDRSADRRFVILLGPDARNHAALRGFRKQKKHFVVAHRRKRRRTLRQHLPVEIGHVLGRSRLVDRFAARIAAPCVAAAHEIDRQPRIADGSHAVYERCGGPTAVGGEILVGGILEIVDERHDARIEERGIIVIALEQRIERRLRNERTDTFRYAQLPVAVDAAHQQPQGIGEPLPSGHVAAVKQVARRRFERFRNIVEAVGQLQILVEPFVNRPLRIEQRLGEAVASLKRLRKGDVAETVGAVRHAEGAHRQRDGLAVDVVLFQRQAIHVVGRGRPLELRGPVVGGNAVRNHVTMEGIERRTRHRVLDQFSVDVPRAVEQAFELLEHQILQQAFGAYLPHFHLIGIGIILLERSRTAHPQKRHAARRIAFESYRFHRVRRLV